MRNEDTGQVLYAKNPHRSVHEGVRDEGQGKNRQRIVSQRGDDIPVQQLMQCPQRPAARAVVPCEPEKWADGVCAGIARVERVQDGDADDAEYGQRDIADSRREPES